MNSIQLQNNEFDTFHDKNRNEVRLKLKDSNYNDSFACVILAPEGQEMNFFARVESFFLTLFSWKYIAIPNTHILLNINSVAERTGLTHSAIIQSNQNNALPLLMRESLIQIEKRESKIFKDLQNATLFDLYEELGKTTKPISRQPLSVIDQFLSEKKGHLSHEMRTNIAILLAGEALRLKQEIEPAKTWVKNKFYDKNTPKNPSFNPLYTMISEKDVKAIKDEAFKLLNEQKFIK